jgi:hypothetical protein
MRDIPQVCLEPGSQPGHNSILFLFLLLISFRQGITNRNGNFWGAQAASLLAFGRCAECPLFASLM